MKINPELFHLARIQWQVFCSLSFKKESTLTRHGASMFLALARKQAEWVGIHFTRLLWCLRLERGDTTGRLHYHAVFAGFPHPVTTRHRLALMGLWESLGGGMARASQYLQALDGVSYIMKGLGQDSGSIAARLAKDYHELTKFGGSCDVTLSESLVKHLAQRLREGPRSNERGGLRHASNTVQRPVSDTSCSVITAATIAPHIAVQTAQG